MRRNLSDGCDQSSANLNNPEHEVTKMAASKYAFRLLEKLGTDPQVYYYSKREWVRKLGDNYLKNEKGGEHV